MHVWGSIVLWLNSRVLEPDSWVQNLTWPMQYCAPAIDLYPRGLPRDLTYRPSTWASIFVCEQQLLPRVLMRLGMIHCIGSAQYMASNISSVLRSKYYCYQWFRDGAEVSTSAIILNLSNLDFSFCLLHAVLMKLFLGRSTAGWELHLESVQETTLLEPTPLPSSEFLLIAIWLFLVSLSMQVQNKQGKSILLKVWGYMSCRVLIWKCFTLHLSGHQLLETCESKREPGAYYLKKKSFSVRRESPQLLCASTSEVDLDRRDSGDLKA